MTTFLIYPVEFARGLRQGATVDRCCPATQMMGNLRDFILKILLVLIFQIAQLSALELYISTTGSDSAEGTKECPLATLQEARTRIRQLPAEKRSEPITVLIRGGTYLLKETVVFGVEDGGDSTVRYVAYQNEKPVFSSGVAIGGWKKLEQPVPGMSVKAIGKLWVADVSDIKRLKQDQPPPAGVASQFDAGWRFLTLYDGDRRLPRARGIGSNAALRLSPEPFDEEHRDFHFSGDFIKNWPDLQESELVIIPMRYWTSNILPLLSVDEENKVARTAVPGTYPLYKNNMAKPVAWVENSISVLDEPGEWYLDSKNCKLYLWPTGDSPGDRLTVPLLTELIRVEGKIDYDGQTDVPVRNLSFRGLGFTQGDRFPWHGKTGWGIQHDWERFDSPTALMRFRGAENCAVENCRFYNSGNTGIRLDLFCQQIRITGNQFQHLGGVGILLAGYGPGTKDVNRKNLISNNTIEQIGELHWASPGIFIWQSGQNTVSNNLLKDLPYAGIVVSGRIHWDASGVAECSRTIRWKETGIDPLNAKTKNLKVSYFSNAVNLEWKEREPWLHSRNNRILRNDIHHAMNVLGDGNCIYVSGAGGGNLIKENYCHDCSGEYMNAIIRCDDDQDGVTIEGNLLCRTAGAGEGIISKGTNHIVNNVIADLSSDARHRGFLVFPNRSPGGSVIQRNIFYSTQKGQLVGQRGKDRKDDVSILMDTDADRNIYWNTADPEWGASHLKISPKGGLEMNSLHADPQFEDPSNGDFRLKPGSPALKIGILPLPDLGEIGPQSR